MKKIFFALALASAAFALSSCDETWDENPKLEGHEGTVQVDFLNPPVMQNTKIMITDANKTGTLHLTCSQPFYGYAAAATYRVQCSLTSDFAVFEEINQDFYNCAEINPVTGEIASAIEKMSGVKTEADLPLPYQPLYMRLRCYIPQSPDNTEYISNVVQFNSVSADYLAIWVAGIPVDYYLRGAMNDWSTGPEWQFATGEEENTWVTGIVTIANGTEFKVADSSWGPFNAGQSEDTGAVYPDQPYELLVSDNPGNLHMVGDFTGQIVMRLEKGVYSIVCDSSKGAPAE